MELHTEQYRMYYVGKSPQRQEAGGVQKQYVQLHVLFIREDHKDVDFCDKHFGPHLRKSNGFAPLRFQRGRWQVFTKAGRSDVELMVNVAVAGSASLMNPPTRVYLLENAKAGFDTPSLAVHRLHAPSEGAENTAAPAVEQRHLDPGSVSIVAGWTGKVTAGEAAGSSPTVPQERRGLLKKWVRKPGTGDSAFGDLQPDELKVTRQDFAPGPAPEPSKEPTKVVYSTTKDSSGSEALHKVWMPESGPAGQKQGLLKEWDGEVGRLQPADLKVYSQDFKGEAEPEVGMVKSQSPETWVRVLYTMKPTKDGSERVVRVRMVPAAQTTTA